MARHLSQTTTDRLRLTATFSAVVVAGLLATACGQAATPTAAKKPQLRVWELNHEIDLAQTVADELIGENADIQFSFKNKTLDGYELSSLKSLSGRQGPDVWTLPDDWLGDHSLRIQPLPTNYYTDESGTVSDLVKKVSELYPSGIVNQILSTDGKQVLAIPSTVDSLQLFYNPEILKTALEEYVQSLGEDGTDEQINPVAQLLDAPPATWSDLAEQVKYLTKRSGKDITRSAVALGSAENVPYAADILQLLVLQNGGKIVSTDRRSPLFDVPETTPAGVSVRPGENALDFYAAFAQSDKPTYSWNPSMPQALDAFGQGKVAMIIGFSDLGRAIAEKYPQLDFDVAAVPQISTATLQSPVNLIRFNSQVITKTADNANLATAFLKLYTDETATNSLASAAYVRFPLRSPFKSVLESNKDDILNKQVLTGTAVWKKHREQFDQAFRQMIIDVTQNGLSTSAAMRSGSDKVAQFLLSEDE
jgi:ABC-type glycerol-3-phosphate transport system substrate-binding protein